MTQSRTRTVEKAGSKKIMRCEICEDADADGVLMWRKSSGKHDMASCRPCAFRVFDDDRDYLYFGSPGRVKDYKQRGDGVERRADCRGDMRQSRLMSATEATVNVLVGYSVAVGTQAAIFPMFGLTATLGQNMAMGAVFTIVSLVRSYLLRRVFNHFSRR